MTTQIQIEDIAVDVVLKDIKNVHLSVYPPTGRVRISAPARMSLDTIRVFAVARLDWIRKQQQKLREQQREMPREYLDRESHFVWGERYLFGVNERDQAPAVELTHNHLILTVRAGVGRPSKAAIVAQWYRDQIRTVAPGMIAKWEPVLGVRVNRLFVRQMKTRWGSCNTRRRTIRLNTELARKPKECLEYVVVHELVHLIEPTHNARFVALMDRFMPQWPFIRQRLNRLPMRHADWEY